MPLLRREAEEVNDAVFLELTFHAAYDPQRAVRTRRHKYVRRFGERLKPVLPNVDDGPVKDLLVAAGWGERELAREELYDLLFDPQEAVNLIGRPESAGVEAGLRERLEAWMRETEDPLLDGPVAAPPGVELNDPDQRSASDPTRAASPA
jgi:N-sulfoglucosamine sulfohydrolase